MKTMGRRDPRVDEYIERAADFAQPVLRHLREVVHSACPEVEETIKWSFPNFEYRGIFCSMAAFKSHCSFGFWDGAGVMGDDARSGAQGQFGPIKSVKDLPSKTALKGYVKKAMALKDAGVRPQRPKSAASRPEADAPEDLLVALKENRRAAATFKAFSPSHRREYVEWITEARRPETRARRIAQSVEWMAVGKARNWKYV
jgi:uncharacterized protein YdeI (YjbR/CyaY-like superfamily)